MIRLNEDGLEVGVEVVEFKGLELAEMITLRSMIWQIQFRTYYTDRYREEV